MRTRLSGPALLLVAGLTLAGCGSSETGTGTSASPGGASGDPVAVATTTPLGSVLTDITSCAGTTSAAVMAPGDDPHAFSPSSAQVAQLAKSKLVVVNGLGLEQGMESTLDSARKDGARILEIAPKIHPIDFGAADHEDADTAATRRSTTGEGDHAREAGSKDPHFWLDVGRMATAATIMGNELADATGDAAYRDCGAKTAQTLKGVDAEVRRTLHTVPEAKRVLITDHDAFGYFAAAYGFKQSGVVVPGGSTEAEPSSADLAKITAVVTREKVPAIFSNTAISSKLVDAVAKESGQNVKVVPLYVDSVGPAGSGAETYREMMTTNASLIAGALK